ncbi:hypothetical protein GDO78_004453 [Eleutherodactylus coqui]|uniref:Uncharacterized protein n=1 Tax=Eleutherodactylus coqui TaxID=57060 RepID=A0A8J6JZS1_ELECQ|nr:hypothetical protein GDO78_004453 [Eleutherodactylus coqui]
MYNLLFSFMHQDERKHALRLSKHESIERDHTNSQQGHQEPAAGYVTKLQPKLTCAVLNNLSACGVCSLSSLFPSCTKLQYLNKSPRYSYI